MKSSAKIPSNKTIYFSDQGPILVAICNTAKIQKSKSCCYFWSYRRINLINLLVLDDGVIDSFLNAQDVVLVAQVTRRLPSDLDAPRRWQGRQVHSCG